MTELETLDALSRERALTEAESVRLGLLIRKDKVKAAAKARYAANPDKVNAAAKAWREANPDKAKAINRAAYLARKARLNAANSEGKTDE